MKRTIAIVCGGDSSEMGVSLRSAQVCMDSRQASVQPYVVLLSKASWKVRFDDGTEQLVDRNDFISRIKPANVSGLITMDYQSRHPPVRMGYCRAI
jgi:D-alanine-D-alanine ligase